MISRYVAFPALKLSLPLKILLSAKLTNTLSDWFLSFVNNSTSLIFLAQNKSRVRFAWVFLAYSRRSSWPNLNRSKSAFRSLTMPILAELSQSPFCVILNLPSTSASKSATECPLLSLYWLKLSMIAEASTPGNLVRNFERNSLYSSYCATSAAAPTFAQSRRTIS